MIRISIPCLSILIFVLFCVARSATTWHAATYILTQNAFNDAPQRYQTFVNEAIEYIEKAKLPDRHSGGGCHNTYDIYGSRATKKITLIPNSLSIKIGNSQVVANFKLQLDMVVPIYYEAKWKILFWCCSKNICDGNVDISALLDITTTFDVKWNKPTSKLSVTLEPLTISYTNLQYSGCHVPSWMNWFVDVKSIIHNAVTTILQNFANSMSQTWSAPQTFEPIDDIFFSYQINNLTFIPDTSINADVNGVLQAQVLDNQNQKVNVTWDCPGSQSNIDLPRSWNTSEIVDDEKLILLNGARFSNAVLSGMGWAVEITGNEEGEEQVKILDAVLDINITYSAPLFTIPSNGNLSLYIDHGLIYSTCDNKTRNITDLSPPLKYSYDLDRDQINDKYNIDFDFGMDPNGKNSQEGSELENYSQLAIPEQIGSTIFNFSFSDISGFGNITYTGNDDPGFTICISSIDTSNFQFEIYEPKIPLPKNLVDSMLVELALQIVPHLNKYFSKHPFFIPKKYAPWTPHPILKILNINKTVNGFVQLNSFCACNKASTYWIPCTNINCQSSEKPDIQISKSNSKEMLASNSKFIQVNNNNKKHNDENENEKKNNLNNNNKNKCNKCNTNNKSENEEENEKSSKLSKASNKNIPKGDSSIIYLSTYDSSECKLNKIGQKLFLQPLTDTGGVCKQNPYTSIEITYYSLSKDDGKLELYCQFPNCTGCRIIYKDWDYNTCIKNEGSSGSYYIQKYNSDKFCFGPIHSDTESVDDHLFLKQFENKKNCELKSTDHSLAHITYLTKQTVNQTICQENWRNTSSNSIALNGTQFSLKLDCDFICTNCTNTINQISLNECLLQSNADYKVNYTTTIVYGKKLNFCYAKKKKSNDNNTTAKKALKIVFIILAILIFVALIILLIYYYRKNNRYVHRTLDFIINCLNWLLNRVILRFGKYLLNKIIRLLLIMKYLFTKYIGFRKKLPGFDSQIHTLFGVLSCIPFIVIAVLFKKRSPFDLFSDDTLETLGVSVSQLNSNEMTIVFDNWTELGCWLCVYVTIFNLIVYLAQYFLKSIKTSKPLRNMRIFASICYPICILIILLIFPFFINFSKLLTLKPKTGHYITDDPKIRSDVDEIIGTVFMGVTLQYVTGLFLFFLHSVVPGVYFATAVFVLYSMQKKRPVIKVKHFNDKYDLIPNADDEPQFKPKENFNYVIPTIIKGKKTKKKKNSFKKVKNEKKVVNEKILRNNNLKNVDNNNKLLSGSNQPMNIQNSPNTDLESVSELDSNSNSESPNNSNVSGSGSGSGSGNSSSSSSSSELGYLSNSSSSSTTSSSEIDPEVIPIFQPVDTTIEEVKANDKIENISSKVKILMNMISLFPYIQACAEIMPVIILNQTFTANFLWITIWISEWVLLIIFSWHLKYVFSKSIGCFFKKSTPRWVISRKLYNSLIIALVLHLITFVIGNIWIFKIEKDHIQFDQNTNNPIIQMQIWLLISSFVIFSVITYFMLSRLTYDDEEEAKLLGITNYNYNSYDLDNSTMGQFLSFKNNKDLESVFKFKKDQNKESDDITIEKNNIKKEIYKRQKEFLEINEEFSDFNFFNKKFDENNNNKNNINNNNNNNNSKNNNNNNSTLNKKENLMKKNNEIIQNYQNRQINLHNNNTFLKKVLYVLKVIWDFFIETKERKDTVKYGNRISGRRIFLIFGFIAYIYIVSDQLHYLLTSSSQSMIENIFLDMGMTLKWPKDGDLFNGAFDLFRKALWIAFGFSVAAVIFFCRSLYEDIIKGNFKSSKFYVMIASLCVAGNILSIPMFNYLRASNLSEICPFCAPKFNKMIKFMSQNIIGMMIAGVFTFKFILVIISIPIALVRAATLMLQKQVQIWGLMDTSWEIEQLALNSQNLNLNKTFSNLNSKKGQNSKQLSLAYHDPNQKKNVNNLDKSIFGSKDQDLNYKSILSSNYLITDEETKKRRIKLQTLRNIILSSSILTIPLTLLVGLIFSQIANQDKSVQYLTIAYWLIPPIPLFIGHIYYKNRVYFHYAIWLTLYLGILIALVISQLVHHQKMSIFWDTLKSFDFYCELVAEVGLANVLLSDSLYDQISQDN
ncbi:hypothetical protein M0812_08488 [Anaeramoeba flamelloides]|uniref:Uncharacterized protein n=1 Tax=Anaeramoeba flamelloides TaxID=1746091 RepID=A0AAV8A067_9EUKA|nr:hypothetical protein M0812_08488 [Anaeramoeba flamelloides]